MQPGKVEEGKRTISWMLESYPVDVKRQKIFKHGRKELRIICSQFINRLFFLLTQHYRSESITVAGRPLSS